MVVRHAVAGLFALTAAGPAALAQQQGTVKSNHGAWSILCDTPAGAASMKSCGPAADAHTMPAGTEPAGCRP